MGIFDFLSYRKAQPVVETAVKKEDNLPEVKKEELIENADSNLSVDNNANSVFETGMPIDAIYAYIERDYEEHGFNDSMCNADNTYKDAKKTIIKDGLKRLFSQVKLRYQDDLRKVEVQINIVEQQGMIDTAALMRAKKETYNEHLRTIAEMEILLAQNDPKMLSMIDSYERGFLKGIAAISQTFIK